MGRDPGAVTGGDEFDFADALPLDIVSPFKTSGAFSAVKGVAIPYLSLESVTYRFGLRQNSTQSFTLRGDSVYYSQGAPRYEEFTLSDGVLTYNFATAALPYVEGGDTLYALSVGVKNPTTGTSKRLFYGEDFTNTSAGVTLLQDWFDEGYTKLHLVYSTATPANYPQVGNNPFGETVHENVSVKPAAIRGKDIDVYVWNANLATPALERWSGVQSFEVSRRVNLEAEEEFGNYHSIAYDYDTADVTGTVTVRPNSPADLFDKIRQIANVASSTAVIGPYSSVPLPVELRIKDPDTGNPLKTLYVPDARFMVPNISGQVGQKLSTSFSLTSDSGTLLVYEGARS